MKTSYLLYPALLLCFALHGTAAYPQQKKNAANDHPKLVVYIVVGSMRADYLHRLRRNFTTKGFRLFINEGAVCSNARYGHVIVQSMAGLATIATGAFPAQHGIIGDSWYDREKDKTISAAYDPQARDLEGSSRYAYSPKNLQTTTLSDELKLVSPASRVFSVAMQPDAAIIMGGHSADAAFWWDEQRGGFTSNNYYMPALPAWVREFNQKDFAASYLTRTWSSLYPIRRYIAKPAPHALVFEQNGESYLFMSENTNANKNYSVDYSKMPASPYADNLLKDFVNTLIVNENLGQEASTDVLMVYLNACKSIGSKHGLLSVELEDAVYRTDENVKQFMSFLQEYVGKERLLVVLTADRGAPYSQQELKANRLPHGIFESKRALILLRSYFKALYGKGEWIKAIHGRQIYFNRLHIDESGKSLQRMQEKCMEFVGQMSGVAQVTLFSDKDNTDMVSNSYFPARSGDLILTPSAGYADDDGTAAAYNYNLHVPLCFYGGRIQPKTIDTPIDMTSVVPTIALMLAAPLPAAARGIPIGRGISKE